MLRFTAIGHGRNRTPQHLALSLMVVPPYARKDMPDISKYGATKSRFWHCVESMGASRCCAMLTASLQLGRMWPHGTSSSVIQQNHSTDSEALQFTLLSHVPWTSTTQTPASHKTILAPPEHLASNPIALHLRDASGQASTPHHQVQCVNTAYWHMQSFS